MYPFTKNKINARKSNEGMILMMRMNKKMVTAAMLGLAFSFGVAYQAPVMAAPAPAETNVSVQVNVQHEAKSIVTWEKGSNAAIEVWGVGYAPANVPAARGQALARYRQLAETIEGVQVDSETTMRDLAIESDVVKTNVKALVKGAHIVDEHNNEDGSYSVKMTIPMFGESSVASVALPQVKQTAFISDIPKASEAFKPTKEEQKVAVGYTGIIIDASGLGLQCTFSPVVFDTNGRAIYGMLEIDRDYAISHGMVEYSNDLQASAANSRAGANPLVVKAVSVKGGGNSVNSVNPVISVEDGDKILFANEKSGMLGKHAVVFVK